MQHTTRISVKIPCWNLFQKQSLKGKSRNKKNLDSIALIYPPLVYFLTTYYHVNWQYVVRKQCLYIFFIPHIETCYVQYYVLLVFHIPQDRIFLYYYILVNRYCEFQVAILVIIMQEFIRNYISVRTRTNSGNTKFLFNIKWKQYNNCSY